jgi:precorrin-2/cobalt-factor-2 C20-methyltransferase
MSGTLYGIGVGPGDPELITLKGLRLLQRVPVVFLPATAPGRSMAGTIARRHLAPERQRIVELVCPPLRERAALLARWRELAREVVRTLRPGEDAAFLTEGDPSLYSTWQYLADAVRAEQPAMRIETVPGVASPFAAAALAGVPLAMWDEPFAVAPASAPAEALRALAAGCRTLAVLKPSARPEALAELVQTFGEGAALSAVRRAGWPEQRIAHGDEALRLAGEDYFTVALLRRSDA